MTDGPYAETKEQMGGFWVIEAADLDAALEWAGKAPRPARGRSRCARSKGERRRSRGLPARSRPLHRHPDPRPRRHRPRRGRGGGGVRDRRRAVARDGDTAQPGRLDHHDRPQPRHRPAPPRINPRRERHLAAHRLHIDRHGTRPQSRTRPSSTNSSTSSPTTSSGSCSSALTPPWPPTPRSRSSCGCSAVSTTGEIARAFVVPEATMAQRIVRAKRKLRDNHASYRIPARRGAPGPAPRRPRRDLPHLHRRSHRHLRADARPHRPVAPKPSGSGGPSSS